MKVKDVMTTSVTTASDRSTLSEVANQMQRLNVGAIPVCDSSNKPIGIVTDRDMVIRGLSSGAEANTPVGKVMTKEIVSVSPETGIHEAARIMAENQVRRLPVVENNTIVGILSIGDLAIRDIYVNEAGDALSNISEPGKHMM